MDKVTQIQYLKEKYGQLSEEYLGLLTNGRSLQQIKDFSYVLDCIRQEISSLESVSGQNYTEPGLVLS